MRAATIGTFDGCHRGHFAVLQTLRKEAEALGTKPLVITFDRHPLEVVAPERAPHRITTPERHVKLLESEGMQVIVEPFTQEVMATTAREWMRRLHDKYDVRVLVMGYDNTFGCDGLQMSIADYATIGKELGIKVVEAPLEKGLSSSAIRRLISDGKIEEANQMLGREYSFEAKVVSGDALGRTIGFPTANLQPEPKQLIPSVGVYSGKVEVPQSGCWQAVINIGRRPTVKDEGPMRIEAHLIGFSGDLYGRLVELSFCKHLRDEQRFASLSELKDAIAADIAAAGAI